MQIRGIPVNIKLNNTVLMIASLIVSVLAGLILGVAGGGRGLNLMLYAVGMAYLKLLFLLAVPLVLLNLISGVMLRLHIWFDNSSPARLWLFHGIAVVGAAVLGMAAGTITGSSQIPAAFAGFTDFGLRWFRTLLPWMLMLSLPIGAAAAKIGPEGEEARRLFRSLADVFAFAGTLLLQFLPVALFCLLCPLIALRGLTVLWPGVKLAVVTSFCCVAYGALVYGYQLRHCLFFRFQRRGRPAQSETHGSYRRDGVCCLELRKTGRQNGHDAIFGNCLYAGGALCRYAGFPDFRNTHLCLDSITFTGRNPIPGKRPVLRTGPSFPAGTAPAGCSSVTAVRMAAGRHALCS